MRPATIFNWHDQSGIQRVITDDPVKPLILTAFSSDKGPEDIRTIAGEDFYKLYGYDVSFERHGQPLIQAAYAIDNGARLLCKRVVASDATLANAAIIVKMKKVTKQKTNNVGQPLYKTSGGEETTESAGNTPIQINTVELTYTCETVENIKTLAEAVKAMESKINVEGADDTFTFPLFVVTDNGRGTSKKRFRIAPDYSVSKNLKFMLYYLYAIGDYDKDSESMRFCVDEDKIYNNESMSYTEKCKTMKQLKGASVPGVLNQFINKIAEITGVDSDELHANDVLFGCNIKGNKIDYINVTKDSINLASEIGFELKSGSNGKFKDAPFGTEEYKTQLINFFSGKFDDSIFDVDRYKPEVCLDANYPVEVKNSIVDLINFREDLFFFRDLGLDNETYDTIIYAADQLTKSKFAADYIQTFEVIDPFSKKHIKVTFTYGLARTIVNHLKNNRNSPVCGIQFDHIFPEAIVGTLNFAPKYTPTEDQKDKLDDFRLNYASYLNDELTLETEYTSQSEFTQLSYINNILSIQEVIRDVRNRCPRYRYQFITNDDLETYKNNVESIIKQYASSFATLEFEYTQDDVMVQNKIFNASIKCTFKNFVQTEIFDIYALA